MNDSYTTTRPVLYSFRRCPYAIRARMAIYYSGVDIEINEVSLKNKPQAMLDASPKGTVPVLCVNGKVIEESLEIMFWALTKKDPEQWWHERSEADKTAIKEIIAQNDNDFKPWLDKYKYSSRYPEGSEERYRNECSVFINELELKLSKNTFLLGSRISLVDVSVFPFVRQFSMVDQAWFDASEYTYVRLWLKTFLNSPLFVRVMTKL